MFLNKGKKNQALFQSWGETESRIAAVVPRINSQAEEFVSTSSPNTMGLPIQPRWPVNCAIPGRLEFFPLTWPPKLFPLLDPNNPKGWDQDHFKANSREAVNELYDNQCRVVCNHCWDYTVHRGKGKRSQWASGEWSGQHKRETVSVGGNMLYVVTLRLWQI